MYILPTYRVREPYFKLRTDDFFFSHGFMRRGNDFYSRETGSRVFQISGHDASRKQNESI